MNEQKSQGGSVIVLLLVCAALWYLINNPGVLRSAATSFHLPSVAASSPAGTSYRDIARQDALATGIPADLFINQVNQESGFDPAARGADGEIGMCQFLPSTAAGLGVDPADPASCLKGMAGVMGRYYREFGGSYAAALAGYNCGGGCVRYAVHTYGAGWGCYVPRSTRAYIRSIMGVSVC